MKLYAMDHIIMKKRKKAINDKTVNEHQIVNKNIFSIKFAVETGRDLQEILLLPALFPVIMSCVLNKEKCGKNTVKYDKREHSAFELDSQDPSRSFFILFKCNETFKRVFYS